MQYEITQEQELLQTTIREFARSEIAPIAARADQEARLPPEILLKLREVGLYGITLPTNYGGAGADFLSLILVSEEISKVSGSLGAQISLHNAVVCESLNHSQNSSLKERLLPKLAGGSFGAFSIDPNSTVKCELVGGDELLLDGSSDYVMSAASADVFLILAKIRDKGKALIAFSKQDNPSEVRGKFGIGEPRKMLGLRASSTSSISFSKFRLPLSSTAFEAPDTPKEVCDIEIKARLAVAAQALGIGQASLDEEVSYAKERSQFNTKIGKFYAVQDFIAMDEIALESARSITYKAASELSSSKTVDRDSCAAKVLASNAAVQAARHSIRVHGGYGFIRDYPVERYLRDARATQIYLESNESMKARIAESLLDL